MKPFIPLLLTAMLLPAVGTAQTIVDDSWADGGRDNGADLLDAAWWTSSASSGIEVSAGSLGLVSGTSGRGIHGTFAPQTLAVGDMLRATFTFRTPATVFQNVASPFRVALADFNNAGLAADLTSSSTVVQPLYVGLPSYMADWDVNTGTTADTSIREHNVAATTGRLLGTTAEWTQLSTGPDENYSFAPNTEYVGVFSVTRTGADSMDIFGSLSQGGTLITSHTESDASGIANHFGLLAFWVNSNTFGSSATPGAADNGIDFSNIKVELTVIPEPSTAALLLSGLLLLLGRSLSSRAKV